MSPSILAIRTIFASSFSNGTPRDPDIEKKLIEPESHVADRTTRLLKSESRQDMKTILWISCLNAALLLAICIIVWRSRGFLPTDLHDVALTKDGKSFPVGQVTWSQHLEPLPCGRTPTEALDRGCHFDIVATAWLPTRCIDYDLINEFESLHSWRYYSYGNGSEQITKNADELGAEEGKIWTTHRWHSAHCLFMWKKLNRALVQGRLTDGETIKQGHTDHCATSIMNTITKDPDEIGAMVEIIYPSC